MGGNWVPAVDPVPLPGPPWLFHALWLLTFLIHLLLVDVVLGGTILAAIAAWRMRGTAVAAGGGAARTFAHGETARLFTGINTWAISLAITFGIAPLLFVQVILGRFFYAATVLAGWAWFSILIFLTAAYYLNYIAKARLRAGRGVFPILAAQSLCFLAIAAIQVAVNLLHAQPGRWERAADQAWSAVTDPSFVPRYLHFVVAAVGMSGALLARIAVARAGAARGGAGAHAAAAGDESTGAPPGGSLDAMARFGIRAALVATGAQLAGGFWLLFSIPREVLLAFFREGALTGVPLLIGVAAGAALLIVLVQIRDPLAEKKKVKRAVELTLAAILVMIITRHQLRGIYLTPSRAGEPAVVEPQWGMVLVFALTLAGAAALAVIALVRAHRDRPGPGEEAA